MPDKVLTVICVAVLDKATSEQRRVDHAVHPSDLDTAMKNTNFTILISE